MSAKKKVLVVDRISEKTKLLSRRYITSEAEIFFSDDNNAQRDLHVPTADVLITHTKGVSKEMLAKAERCVFIQKYGAGVNNIAIAEASQRGIPVGYAVGQNARSVAEYAVMLMLAVYKHLTTAHGKLVNEGLWLKAVLRDTCYELSGKKVGIIGLGNIGRQVARLLRGFECKVAYNDLYHMPEQEQNLGVTFMALDTLIRESDVVTLHVPLTELTNHMINKERLLAMKPTAVLINTSRGAVVDEKALVEVLQSGHLLGAGLDVYEAEPIDQNHPLAKIERVILSPHTAGGTNESMEAVVRESSRNINSMLTEGRVVDEKSIVNWQELKLRQTAG
ncbi:MAG: 2-hydroxyacid dehydrogenase [Candidatus Korobacteraceae bacterium]|jgi:D-3-phosphoglycerate dehydrogenase